MPRRKRVVVVAAAMVVKFKIQFAVIKAKEWSLMRHVWMDPMNESCNCEVGRDPEVGKLDSLAQGSVVNAVHARVETGDE